MTKKFCVVLFVETNEVDVVPSNWISSSEVCHWPPYKDSAKISRAVSKGSAPEPHWKEFNVKLLKSYDTVVEARLMAARAENCSSLETEDDSRKGRGYRKKFAKRRIELSSDSSDTDRISENDSDPDSTSQLPPLKRSNALPFSNMNKPSTEFKNKVLPEKATAPNNDDTNTILLAIAKLQENQHEIMKMLTNLQSKPQLHEKSPQLPDDMMNFLDSFPLDTLSSFDTLEEYLASSHEFKKALIRKLEVLGGSSCAMAVKLCINKVMTKRLKSSFNMEGKACWKTKEGGSKRGFKGSYTCSIIKDSILSKNYFISSEHEIFRRMATILKNATA